MKFLKPGGSIFITTINKTLVSWLGAIIIAEYIFDFIPRGTHEWNKFIPPYQVQHILDKCKFNICHLHKKVIKRHFALLYLYNYKFIILVFKVVYK